jgi:hypothetical protein
MTPDLEAKIRALCDTVLAANDTGPIVGHSPDGEERTEVGFMQLAAREVLDALYAVPETGRHYASIHSPSGVKVRFVRPKEAVSWSVIKKESADLLQDGAEYILDHAEIHSWHTRFYLVGFPCVAFSSTWFDAVDGPEDVA